MSEAISSGCAPRHGAPPRHLLPRSHRNALGSRSEAPEQQARGEKQEGKSSRARQVPAGELSVLSPTVWLQQVAAQPVVPSHEPCRGSEPRRWVPQAASPTLLQVLQQPRSLFPHPQYAQEISAARVVIQQPGPGTTGTLCSSRELQPVCSQQRQPCSRSSLHPRGRFRLLLMRISPRQPKFPATAGPRRAGSSTDTSLSSQQIQLEPGLRQDPTCPTLPPNLHPGRKNELTQPLSKQTPPPAPQERKPGLRAAHGQPHPTTGSAPQCQPQPSSLALRPPGVGASLSAPPEDLASCLEVAAGQEPGEPRRRLSCGCLAGHTPGPGWLEAPWALRRGGGAKIPRSPLRHQKCARLPTVPLRRAFYPQGCRAETFPARKRPRH